MPYYVHQAETPHTSTQMISNKVHALYKINKGGIKTACVEFVEFDDSENVSVTIYKLKASGGHSSLLAIGRPEYTTRKVARALWKSVKEAGYTAIA